jgi:hypothetical protein
MGLTMGVARLSEVASDGTRIKANALREDPTEPIVESEKEELPRNPQTKRFDKSAFVYDEEGDVDLVAAPKFTNSTNKKTSSSLVWRSPR